MRAMSVVAALSLFGTARAACVGEPASTVELQQVIEKTEIAFGGADFPGFVDGSDALRDRLPCAVSEIPAPLAAAIHRMLRETA